MASPSEGSIVTYNFSGTVTTAYLGNPLDPFELGDRISGSFTYDDPAVPISSGASYKEYAPSAAPLNFTLSDVDHPYPAPWGPQLSSTNVTDLYLENTATDQYLDYYANLNTSSFAVLHLSFEKSNAAWSAFSPAEIPAFFQSGFDIGFMNLSVYDPVVGIDTTLGPGPVVISIDSAESDSPAVVPEPSTFILAGLGLLGLGCVALRKKFRRG